MGTPAVAAYAGFWRRCAAACIDGILINIVVFFVYFIVRFFMSLSAIKLSNAEGLGFIIGMLTPWMYFATMESSSKQATLGKMALGIIVTDAEGKKVSFDKATARHFGKVFSAVILCMGFIMAGVTARKQALHDSMACCVVVLKM